MVSIDWRLRVRHWFKKYRKIIFIVILVWAIIFIINKYLQNYTVVQEPNTTYTPSVSVMDSSSSVSTKVHTVIEELIDEYVGYCNEGNYQKAFNMLSEDCQKYAFDDDIVTFAEYVLNKLPNEREYSIQNYSNYGDYYIYEVKYIDNILATGLTNSTYMYTTEKMVFTKNSDGTYDMATGNFISYDTIASVAENDYVKIDIKSRTTMYSIEEYEVKFTNRTDSTVVISDGIVDDEVELVLPYEYRDMENVEDHIILAPDEDMTLTLTFSKFADDGDESQSILFSSIRVIEDYKGVNGTEEEQQIEIDNAIAKFSMQVPVN